MPDDNIQEVYDNDIDMYLKEFQKEQGIEDLRTISQNLWNAAMMYIQRHLFTDRDILKQKKNIYNTNTIIPTNCNSYDYDLLNNICDYYIYLCSLYDKECSIWGYSRLLNIPYALIQEWGNNYKDSNRLSSLSSNIYKKLTDAREQSLVAKLMSMKHPTAIAIVLNKDYSYNLPGVSKEIGTKSSLSSSELPKLGNINADAKG